MSEYVVIVNEVTRYGTTKTLHRGYKMRRSLNRFTWSDERSLAVKFSEDEAKEQVEKLNHKFRFKPRTWFTYEEA